MTSKLLLVEPSATMRFVIENYAQSLGYSVLSHSDYPHASDALHQQYRAYGSDFAGVILGWPVVNSAESDALLSQLEKSEFADLPVVVMSTDMRAETKAWVASRNNTSILAWKEYQGLAVTLNRMLTPVAGPQVLASNRLANNDIQVLIVDDSISIRYALRDLFQLQGYQVKLASNHDEAVSLTHQHMFDIAVIDFYLQGSTGDELTKSLLADPASNHITCAILTGTYADHIIKRSLNAGAVECMFKNESSELLMARIGALSQFVRQRKQLVQQRLRLDQMIDSLAGATLVIGHNEQISYASEQACRYLGFANRSHIIGLHAGQVVDIEKLRASQPGKYQAQWTDSAHGPVNVVYRQLPESQNNELIINFRVMPTEKTPSNDTPAELQAQDLIAGLKLHPAAHAFVDTLMQYSTLQANTQEFISLLVLDVFAQTNDEAHVPVSEIAGLSLHVATELKQVYRRENHVVQLDENRYGFLLRHTTEPQAYLLTRKIMQLCNAIKPSENNMTLSSTGCLISLSNNRDQSALQLLENSFQGMDAVNARGYNQALLLDLKRMLPTYPAK